MSRTLRRFLKAASAVTLAVLVAAGGAAAFLQTTSGKSWLAGALSRALSSPDATVTLSSIEGSVPFDLRIREIRVADADGAWLTVTDAAVDIAARDLLRGRLTVRRLGAGGIVLTRLPVAAAQEDAEPTPLAIPELPVDIEIRSLAVPRVHLADAVLGEPVTASIDGSFRLTGADAEAQLAIERLDGGAGHARLTLNARRHDSIALRVDVAEPSGMLLKRVLARDEPVPLAVAIDGAGPVDSWRGTLHATAGAARADAAFTIRRDGGYRIASEGSVSMTGLLPEKLAALAAHPLDYAATAAVDGGIIAIETLSLTAGTLALEARGRYDRDARTVAGEATGSIGDLAALESILGIPAAGTATIRAQAEGTLDRPRARISLSAQNLGSGGIAAGDASASADIALSDGTWRLTGSGAIDALSLPLDRPGLPKRLDWDMTAHADEGFTQVALERLELRGGGATITASGTAEMHSPAARIDAAARLDVADLSLWRDLAALPLGGRLAVDVEAESRAGAITATIDGQAQDFNAGQSALDALLGGLVRLQGTVTRVADGTIAARALTVEAAHATATADATISGDFERIDGKMEVGLPRLAVLASPLGRAVGGKATGHAGISGSPAQPRIDARIEAADLRIDAQRLDQLAVDVTLTDVAAPAGTLAATFKAAALDGRADATFARTAPGTLSIPKFAIAAPGTTVEGALDILLDKALVAGTVNARVADLAPWSTLAGTRLSGAAEAHAALAATDGQRVEIDASIRNLRIDDAGATIARARIDARLADVLGKPSGKAAIDATGVALPGWRADTVRLTGQSTGPGRFTLAANAQGALNPGAGQSPFRLSAASEIAIDEGEQLVLRVKRLSGRFGGHDLASQAPLTVAFGAGRQRFEGLDLRIGAGRLTGAGSHAGDRLALKLDARSLPLELARLVAPAQRFAGTLGATLDVSGTVAQPAGRFEADIRNLRSDGAGKDMPPLAVTARGTWKDARLDLAGRIEGPQKTGLDLTGTLPLRLDPKTLMPAVPGDGAIRATARGDGRIETWADLLPLGEDRLSGRYSVDIVVNGTVAAPAAGGRVTVTDGRYVNFAAGTELRNIALELAGEGGRYVLRKFAATDAENGTIGGSGFVDLAATPGPAFEVSATFDDFQVMRRDELTGNADGKLRLAGTAADAALSGGIRMNRMEIRIPERLPPNVARLEVVEIDSGRGKPVSKPTETSDGPAIALDVQIEIPARAFVRGRGLDSEWKGKAHLGGTVAKPDITGTLETVRGDFSLLGKRFVLAASTVTFNGGDEIDPLLSIVAEHKSPTILAQALITGSAANPSVRLTSQPELPQDEVLAQVLFGKGAGEITPVQGLQLAQAAATLAGRGGPGILDRIRSATGLDRLDVSAGDSGASGMSGTKVTAGEYVSDRVFVGIEQGAAEHSTRSKVEVEVLPNVTVESSVGANSSAGVGVNWKWDY